ncbi:GAF domain-containing protein [Candidatus Dojkabacteria bacterium]|uniref:GAF domain-containing protein n=1 Tax=Candidatus Dojkabacteria bacterium TaxID=2099670 RepID=A0A955IAC3_9BACT|nr:GAF domain-containing protein [Candidatus Dojkabacteria bacterium]
MKIEQIEKFIKQNKISDFAITLFFTLITGIIALIINSTPEIPNISLIIVTAFILIIAPFYNRITFYLMIIVFTVMTVIFLDSSSADFTPALVRLFTFDIFLLVAGEGFINLSESRDESKKALASKTALLEVIVYFVQKVVDNKNIFDELPYVMQQIGQTSNVSRVYIFTVGEDGRGSYMSQRYEWTNGNTTVQIDNPELQKLYFTDAGFQRWLDLLNDEKNIRGNVSEFPDSEKPMLQSQEIKSLLISPIIAGEKLWGFIGFDECRIEREWNNNLVEILRLFANLLGSSINSTETSKKLLAHTKELEEANRLMVNRELRILELKNRISKLENPDAKPEKKAD